MWDPTRGRPRVTHLRSGLRPSLRAPRSAALARLARLAVEGVSEVTYLRGVMGGVDCYYVEANLAEAREASGGQELRCGANDAALLSLVDRFLGAAEAPTPAQSYLDEAERVAVEGHEVQLRVPEVNVACENAVAPVLQEGLCDVLAAAAQCSRVPLGGNIRRLRDREPG